MLVGSLQTWVVFAVQPLFGLEYLSGLDLGFGIVTALAGMTIIALCARSRLERRSAWIAFGLSLVVFVALALAVGLAMNHDPSDGRGFDGIDVGVVLA